MEDAEKVIPEFYIPLFGERRKLDARFGTLIRFEQKTGRNAMDMRTWTNPSLTDIAGLFWAALGGEKFGKTIEDVANEMSLVEDSKDIAQWSDLVQAILGRAAAQQKKTGAA